MAKSFVHLHLHTEYSMLDGAARIAEVVATAAADGQPAVGHHRPRQHVRRPRLLPRGASRPISRRSSGPRPTWSRPAVTTGRGATSTTSTTSRCSRNRRRATATSSRCRRTPTSTASSRNHASTSSCSSSTTRGWSAPAGVSAARCHRLCWRTTTTPRRNWSARFQSIFGRDSFFVELQDHGLPEQPQVNPQLIRLARDMRAPLLATNDRHYTHRDDAEAHDAPAVRADGRDARRPEAVQVRRRRVLPEDRARRCVTSSPTTRRRATTRY